MTKPQQKSNLKHEKLRSLQNQVNRLVKQKKQRPESDLNISWDEYWDIVNDSLIEWEQVKNAVENMADKFQDLYEETGDRSYVRRSVALHDCGSHIVYGANGRIIYINGCRDRMCPSCNRRHARQTLKELKLIVDTVTRLEESLPEKERSKWYMLTLTVPSVPGRMLKDALSEAIGAFGSFMNQRYFSFVKGYYRTTEITYNKQTGLFHPHFHVFLQVDPVKLAELERVRGYFLQREWTRLNNYYYTDYGDLNKEYNFNYSTTVEKGLEVNYRANEILFTDKPILENFNRKSVVTYHRTGLICDYETVLTEYDHFLDQDVISTRNLLQVECHEFVDFKDSKGAVELCKYVSDCIFHVDEMPLSDLDCFAQAVKGLGLYRHSNSFSKILKDHEAGKYDEFYNLIDTEENIGAIEQNQNFV